MPSPNLDIFQQTFSLAMMASSIVDKQGTLEELQQYYYEALTSNLQGLEGGKWSLVGGPIIWKQDALAKTPPGNAGYIAFHPNALFEDGSVHPTYVIAISGTPMGSEVLHKEDNAVNSVVDFNAWVAGGINNPPVPAPREDVSERESRTSYFSRGIAWGTYNLMNAKSCENYSVSPGQTMVQFLRSVERSPSTRFIVAGHSLGGALTTTISLTLVTADILPRGYTIAYPAAAYSAGNLHWARQWAETFPPCKVTGGRSFQGWNLNLVNNLDCVPQLWCQVVAISPKQWIGRIPSLYGIPIVETVWQQYINFATYASSSGMVYKPIPSQYFDGPPPPSVPFHHKGFSKEAIHQHAMAYIIEVGIDFNLRPSDAAIALQSPITNGFLQAIDDSEDQEKKCDHTAHSLHALLA